MLDKIFKKEQICLKAQVEDWEEAVRLGGRLLLEAGCIEVRYIEAMIATVKELGPYIVIAPGIAMPHSRPENGSNKIGMSLIILEEGVCFGHEKFDPVRIVICLCALDHSSHLTVLAQLSNFLDDRRTIDKLLSAEDVGEVISIIHQYSKP